MVRRRPVLHRIAALVVAGSGAGLAGCTFEIGDVPGDEERRPESEPEDDVTDDDPKTVRDDDDVKDDSDDDGTEDEPELGIEHIRFVEEEPTGYREYTEVSEYGPDDTIWIYFEPRGFELEERDGERWFDLGVTASVTDPDGEDVRPVRDEVSEAIPDGRDPEDVFLYVDLSIRSPMVGEYTVDLRVRDRVRRGSASESTSFTIADEELELIARFRESIEDLTEVEIERLTMDDETLRLVYQSPSSGGDVYEEVGVVAGAYAGVIESGLSAESLVATGTDADGDSFVFTIETEKATAWNEGEITEDEYVEYVTDAVRYRS